MKKSILIAVAVALVLIQFIGIDKSKPQYDPGADYFSTINAPAEVQRIIKESCYDCHSFETNYPWYSNVSPVSWLLQKHIDEGREHMNFSEWAHYTASQKNKLIEESMEEIEANKMPLKSYTLLHPESKLDPQEKETILNWLLSQGATSILAIAK
jgi:hypothetical protein